MKIRIQPKDLGAPQIIEDVQSIVVYDNSGNPIHVTQQFDQHTIIQERAGNPNFAKMLRALGIGLNAPVKVLES